ncbi:CMD domain protein [Arthrobacter sp. 35W]|uniref:CMD domain protein n=1 Tax=Arthrobacter sp. 35W TaxID=1132441 RepID=UPI0004152B85|nr:CMD domain protein [Arthrobacter sp. 35W]
MTTTIVHDAVDTALGIEPGSYLDKLRNRRPTTRENAQASHEALFNPEDDSEVTRTERHALAAFIARLHGDTALASLHREGLLASDSGPATGTALADAIDQAATAGATSGPYGHYREEGPLQGENTPGLRYVVPTPLAAELGPRLTAALEHAHLLVFRPREASPEALATLHRAGWSTDAIVTLSQLVAFLAFQLRVAAGLRVLSDVQGQTSTHDKATTTTGENHS